VKNLNVCVCLPVSLAIYLDISEQTISVVLLTNASERIERGLFSMVGFTFTQLN